MRERSKRGKESIDANTSAPSCCAGRGSCHLPHVVALRAACVSLRTGSAHRPRLQLPLRMDRKAARVSAGVFAVDVGNYTILSNHNTPSCTRPDIVTRWSDEEVAWRWICAWPQWNGTAGWPRRRISIQKLLADPGDWRVQKNLASLSWFMAGKNQSPDGQRRDGAARPFLRAARLPGTVEQAAVLIGLIYLDLNQLRAGLADSLAANYSAIQRRIAVAAFGNRRQRGRISEEAVAASLGGSRGRGRGSADRLLPGPDARRANCCSSTTQGRSLSI